MWECYRDAVILSSGMNAILIDKLPPKFKPDTLSAQPAKFVPHPAASYNGAAASIFCRFTSRMTATLPFLLRSLTDFQATGVIPDTSISAVTADSRQVQPGTVFVAIRGGTTDGHRFVPDALARGAAAVVGTEDLAAQAVDWPAPYVRVADSRLALATLAAALYGFPTRAMRLIGVTGTDGKTTTTNLITHILRSVGLHAGMISTIGAKIGDADLDTGLHVTTPDAPDIQRYLAQMRDAGCEIAVLETTSHGLHQGRVAAVDFDVAVVTNVTHEHLDYHGSWDAYLDAKATLFRSLAGSTRKLRPDGSSQPKVAVLNADDGSFDPLRAIPSDLLLSYGVETSSADLHASQIAYLPDRTTFAVQTPAGATTVDLPLAGPFNVYNCLAAIGAGLAVGLPLKRIVAAVTTTPGVDGRMERIDCGQDFIAIVDFAHTPISLQRALEAVRQMTSGRVIAVFGSAGLRDEQKRYLMAETSVRLADLTVLTAEDPRTESLGTILAQMAEGAQRAGGVEGRDFLRIPDRSAAVLQAVNLARPGDVVVVCGKGHERSMCFGVTEHPWRDHPVVRWALERRLGLTVAPPPFVLPTTPDDL